MTLEVGLGVQENQTLEVTLSFQSFHEPLVIECEPCAVSTVHRSEEEILAGLANCPDGNPLYQHLKTGRLYRVTGKCARESDGEPCVLYRRAIQHTPKVIIWCRPLSEWQQKFRPYQPPIPEEVPDPNQFD